MSYHTQSTAPLGWDPGEARKVTDVLDDPSYDWSTFNGLLKALDMNPEHLRDILQKLVRKGDVISTIDPKTGDIVYTTKGHYRSKHNFFDDSLSAGTGYASF